MPGWAVCWRAGLGDLMGLWPELSALSRDPGLFLRAACAPRVCCVFVPLRNAAQSPQLLINLHGEPWASKHHPPALWMASPSRAFTCCLYWWIWGASVLQCPAHSHEHSPRICTHTRPGLRFPWVWDPPERFVKGKVSAGTIVWHWGGWRCGTRAQECSSQLSELRFSGCILTVSPPCVSLLALSSASASSRLVPCRAVALSHRLWLPNKFGLC